MLVNKNAAVYFLFMLVRSTLTNVNKNKLCNNISVNVEVNIN